MIDESKRILVVDDDPDIRELLAEYISKQGLSVTAVGDGAEMDRALSQNDHDLVILDLMMPGEDGLSIARRLKRTSDLPIIILTALSDSVDTVVGLELGADDYVGKPFNPRVLLARIRAVLRRHESVDIQQSFDGSTILVVDDDEEIRNLLGEYLSNQGFKVVSALDAKEMDSQLSAHSVDLVLLDLRMPGEDGLHVATRLKQAGDLPIIIMTAIGDEVEQVVGLELGADDYINKPFEPRELLARVKAVLRRSVGESVEILSDGVYEFGEYRLDPKHIRLSKNDGSIVSLTSGEFDLLHALVRHPFQILDRDRILELLYQDDRSGVDRSIDVRVTRLRGKIETDPSDPVFIRTIWGKGYMFCPYPA